MIDEGINLVALSFRHGILGPHGTVHHRRTLVRKPGGRQAGAQNIGIGTELTRMRHSIGP